MVNQTGFSLVFLGALTFSLCPAQESSKAMPADSFDMATYIRPAIEYRSLTLNPSIGFSSYNPGGFITGPADAGADYNLEFPGIAASPRFSASLTDARYSQPRTASLNIYSTLLADGYRASRYDDKFDDIRGLSDQERRSAGLSVTLRYAYTAYLPNNLFAGASTEASTLLQGFNRTSEENKSLHRISQGWSYYYQKTKQTDDQQQANVSFSLPLGLGRIYDATAAAVALQILDMTDRMKNPATAHCGESIRKFAGFLDWQKNRRILDSRSGRIEDVAAICAYLRTHTLVDTLSPEQVMMVDEQWSYSWYPQRNSGLELQLFPSFDLSYLRDSSGQSMSFGSNFIERATFTRNEVKALAPVTTYSWRQLLRRVTYRYDYSANLQLRYSRPLSRRYQFDGMANARGGIVTSVLRKRFDGSGGEKRSHLEISYPSLQLSLYSELKYIPTTRSSYSIAPSLTLVRDFKYTEKRNSTTASIDAITAPIRNIAFQAALRGSGNYWFSPRVSHSFGASVGGFYVTRTYCAYPNKTVTSMREKQFNYQLYWNLNYSVW